MCTLYVANVYMCTIHAHCVNINMPTAPVPIRVLQMTIYYSKVILSNVVDPINALLLSLLLIGFFS